MNIQPVWQGCFSFFSDLPVIVEASAAQLSSDAGLLPIREFDEQIGFTKEFADALDDPRDPLLVEHSVADMVRARLYGILADYEDQNDHDVLRHDPVFKLLAERSPDGADLASQPTLSRFENAVTIASLKRLRDVLIDQFIASFATPPQRLTFDLDAVDDPAHGAQQLVLFHGYFEQYQYFPAFITSADNDQFVVVSLRAGAVHAALGCEDDLAYLVMRLRRQWPAVRIIVRGDAAYGVPWMYAVCEGLGIDYTFGLAANAVLKRVSEDLLNEALSTYQETQIPQRRFTAFWYQAASWPAPRWVVVKAEANAQGTNRRFVVTNRPGAQVLPEATYDEYAERGESENRNKEIKCDLAMDRMSDHRFMANYFRLYLSAAAMNLLSRLRQHIAAPPPLPEQTLSVRDLSVAERKRYEGLRRRHDPLGEGQPSTWRTLLIKVAAQVLVSSRRVVIRLSSTWPNLEYFEHVCRRLGCLLPPRPSPESG